MSCLGIMKQSLGRVKARSCQVLQSGSRPSAVADVQATTADEDRKWTQSLDHAILRLAECASRLWFREAENRIISRKVNRAWVGGTGWWSWG